MLPPVLMGTSTPAEVCSLHQVPTGLVVWEALTLVHLQFKVALPVFLMVRSWGAGVAAFWTAVKV